MAGEPLQLAGTLTAAARWQEAAPVEGDAVAVRLVQRVARLVIESTGQPLQEEDSGGKSGKHLGLLSALCKLVRQQNMRFFGTVLAVRADSCDCQLSVYLPARLWAAPQVWRAGSAAAQLFAHLRPIKLQNVTGSPSRAEPNAQEAAPGATAIGNGNFTLATCFEQLPQHAPDVELPELQISPDAKARLSLADVPLPLLQSVVSKLGRADVARLALTCRFMRALASDAVPGLHLALYPHQRAALHWMLAREEVEGVLPDPCYRAFQTEDGFSFWGCAATGAFRTEAPRPVHDSRGGFFCDEPGLGKTITILALILKTKGTLAEPPAGMETHLMRTEGSKPKRFGYYLLPTAAGRRSLDTMEFDKLLLPVSGSGGTGSMSPGPQAQPGRRMSGTGVQDTMEVSEAPSSVSDTRKTAAKRVRQETNAQHRLSSSRLPTEKGVSTPGSASAMVSSIASDGGWSEIVTPATLVVRMPTGRVEGSYLNVSEVKPHNHTTVQAAVSPATPAGKRAKAAVECSIESVSAGPAKKSKPESVAAETPAEKRGKMAAQRPGEDGEGEERTFVQCELCNKWRGLPTNAIVDKDAPWMCLMHPEPWKAFCSVDEDVDQGWQFETTAGFVPKGSALGLEENVSHFRQLLGSYPELLEERTTALWWLARQDPEAIARGMQVPRVHLEETPPSFAELFKEMGFEEATKTRPSPRTKPPSGQTPDGQTPARRRSNKLSPWQPKVGSWRQPYGLMRLRLDTVALLEALHLGPLEVQRKVFLSAATLLVVPAPLVQHWVHQAEQHVAEHSLEILVVSNDRNRSHKTPPAHSLAWDYDLVITTMPLLSAIWADKKKRMTSPFMKVHWLRVVVDEGHMLGNSLSMTNRLQMGCALHAERRWLMTGTPTPSGPTSDVAHLQPLLAFLHNEPFGTEPVTWQEAVQKPFEAKQALGMIRLKQLLGRIMIRAAKSDLVTIPPLFSKVTVLDFAPAHAISYNMLVDVVQRNLLTSDWYDEDHHESLLNPTRNAKWAKEMLSNIKKACCVAGQCNLETKESDIKETLELLSERGKLPKVNEVGPPWLEAGHPLTHIEAAMRASTNAAIRCCCQKCGSITRMPLITPCAHLLCSTCTSADKLKCPLPDCQTPYVMQGVDDPIRKETNPLPKWEVPMELIEWQPSYTQKGAVGIHGGAWSEDWQFTDSTKCVHLLKRLYEIGAATDAMQPITYSQRVQRHLAPGSVDGGLTKVIIFSQFWMHLLVVKAHLSRRAVRFEVLRSGLTAAEKAHVLDTFKNDRMCGVLIMDQTGVVGLDLSFASWVFLMEPLEDISVHQQVVSRAHRMGAKQPVHLETLVMKGTAEEQLVRLGAQAKAEGRSALHSLGGIPEKDQAQAQERSRRNHILRAMRRVQEASLPDFQDLPISSGQPLC